MSRELRPSVFDVVVRSASSSYSVDDLFTKFVDLTSLTNLRRRKRFSTHRAALTSGHLGYRNDQLPTKHSHRIFAR